MKLSIYPQLAINSIRKNKRLYIPYILTCSGMIMMFYIMAFLAKGKAIENMAGANFIYLVLNLGCIVIGVFSLIFLFYTNSFLIRRRKKEFGLYNILGMGKPNLAIVLICESVTITIISLVIGLFFGILFSKFAELVMVNILKLDADFSFTIEWTAVKITITLFAVIFLLLLINTLRQIRLSEPIEMLRSENAGEKPPKSNILLAVLGVAILAGAYYIAVTIKEPLTALLLFFVAVVMVIAATYMLFIAGSVSVCKALQKNKNYYYKTNHFVSTSSMIYRMKRNGAGLASICILCTMVLVMLSSTICLYTGAENSINTSYPRDILIETASQEMSIIENTQPIVEKKALQAAEAAKQTPQNILDYHCAQYIAKVDGNKINTHNDLTDCELAFIISVDDYNKITGNQETLADDEVMIYRSKNKKFKEPKIVIQNTNTYKVKKVLPEFITNNIDGMNVLSSLYIVVNDIESFIKPVETLADFKGDRAIYFRHYYGYDLECDDNEQIEIFNQLLSNINTTFTDNDNLDTTRCYSRADERAGFYDIFGSLFFLGILLGIVFIFAAVLIIYYKQISEGYEDQSRFEIMQKVGMDKKEIRKSINSQVLTVFFLPLAMSAVHLGFAFPMIYKMLILFGITDLKFLILITLACFALFALFYILVYKITSKAYYSIVINAKKE
ncbi:MAG: ABC transporter permease [Eubacterium sp.]|nr:ABC transporter permease [Eubacterium sp.]MDE6156145.1 ABC transporter permease [Eubacterium sp.]MDE6767855.1 ABC transporter permease [Eubacterium sp.]